MECARKDPAIIANPIEKLWNRQVCRGPLRYLTGELHFLASKSQHESRYRIENYLCS